MLGLPLFMIIQKKVFFDDSMLPFLPTFVCLQTQTASENVSSLWNPWVQLFVCENATLIVKLNQFFASPPSDVLEKLPSELTNEWSDFFIEGIFNLLLPLPISITGVYEGFFSGSFDNRL